MCLFGRRVWRCVRNIAEMISTEIENIQTIPSPATICGWRDGLDVFHYNDVIMGEIASQITSLTIVYSTVYSDADQRKHQSSASLAFVRGIHRGPVNSPHKRPVTRKMFPFDDVIMHSSICVKYCTAQEIYILFDLCCVLLWFGTGQFYHYPSVLQDQSIGTETISQFVQCQGFPESNAT